LELRERLASHTDANAQLFDDLEVFYNQRRWHLRTRRPTLVKCDLMRSVPDTMEPFIEIGKVLGEGEGA
jgi:hypothetical protein